MYTAAVVMTFMPAHLLRTSLIILSETRKQKVELINVIKMLDAEGISAIIRHQRLEIETLEGTKNHLLEKVSQLKGFPPQTESFQASINHLPTVREERDAMFRQLQDIAKERLEENSLDVSAQYCLYLLTSLAAIEKTNEELEETYIQTKFGEDLVKPVSSISYEIPAEMDRITESYASLKAELALAESHLDVARKANESMRRELDEARKRYEKMSSSIPSLVRQAEDDVAQVEEALRAKEEQYKSASERLETRQVRATQRNALITELISKLDSESLALPNGRQQQMMSSLRSLLTAVNTDEVGTDVTMMSHARALVHLGNAQHSKPQTPEKPHGPAPQSRPPLTPSDLPERARRVKTMLAKLSPRSPSNDDDLDI